ncbi:hypothetical protein MP638_007258 [Amoeboaphelidium occidentale]|nr:hypothetical protein MP638_007258 [Amoeboaphelidium occidentale]
MRFVKSYAVLFHVALFAEVFCSPMPMDPDETGRFDYDIAKAVASNLAQTGTNPRYLDGLRATGRMPRAAINAEFQSVHQDRVTRQNVRDKCSFSLRQKIFREVSGYESYDVDDNKMFKTSVGEVIKNQECLGAILGFCDMQRMKGSQGILGLSITRQDLNSINKDEVQKLFQTCNVAVSGESAVIRQTVLQSDILENVEELKVLLAKFINLPHIPLDRALKNVKKLSLIAAEDEHVSEEEIERVMEMLVANNVLKLSIGPAFMNDDLVVLGSIFQNVEVFEYDGDVDANLLTQHLPPKTKDLFLKLHTSSNGINGHYVLDADGVDFLSNWFQVKKDQLESLSLDVQEFSRLPDLPKKLKSFEIKYRIIRFSQEDLIDQVKLMQNMTHFASPIGIDQKSFYDQVPTSLEHLGLFESSRNDILTFEGQDYTDREVLRRMKTLTLIDAALDSEQLESLSSYPLENLILRNPVIMLLQKMDDSKSSGKLKQLEITTPDIVLSQRFNEKSTMFNLFKTVERFKWIDLSEKGSLLPNDLFPSIPTENLKTLDVVLSGVNSDTQLEEAEKFTRKNLDVQMIGF